MNNLLYKNATDYLFSKLPMFQRVGASAYKTGLGNIVELCNLLGNPQDKIKTVHVAGTNGKGSTSHMLAATLQMAGYKTGLHTSPHLKDFTERSRINGVSMDQQYVIDFVEKNKSVIERMDCSFFEITVAMAFDYFAKNEVDIAIIEVGMGGRLDSTNIIKPLLSVITKIDYDHTQFLGDTLPKIASEKAGIIKKKTPVVISLFQPETHMVFEQKAKEQNAPIYFADKELEAKDINYNLNKLQFNVYKNGALFLPDLQLDLSGFYQTKNVLGALKAIELLKEHFTIEEQHIRQALKSVMKLTGLKGRWQLLQQNPLIICDTGHNKDGITQIINQINSIKYDKLYMVFGMVNDKDITEVLKLLPTDAYYIFTQAKIPRAMDANELKEKAAFFNINGEVEKDVNNAIAKAKKMAKPNDFIFIGGSTFVVAEIENL
jgi:dihydrofolate synthase / folylpolyglutamate synthase